MGFNRTFMELKRNGVGDVVSLVVGFNRTFMELKQHTLQLRLQLSERFNRTFMELKQILRVRVPLSDRGLIVPLWN